MNSKKYRIKEYILASKNRLGQLSDVMLSTISQFTDGEKLIYLSMDNLQNIHSISFSENLFLSYKENEIIDRITRLINYAVFITGRKGANDVKNVVSLPEFDISISNEANEIRDNFELLRKNTDKTLNKLLSINRTAISNCRNIQLNINGTRTIQAMTIKKEYLCLQNKEIFETELKNIINAANREIQMEIQELMEKNEEEFVKNLNY